jgi:SAM-dependent methyltransferase
MSNVEPQSMAARCLEPASLSSSIINSYPTTRPKTPRITPSGISFNFILSFINLLPLLILLTKDTHDDLHRIQHLQLALRRQPTPENRHSRQERWMVSANVGENHCSPKRSARELQPYPFRQSDPPHPRSRKSAPPASRPAIDNKQRDRAWEIHPYPCVGQLRIIDLCLSRSPSYQLVLSRLQNGARLLDLGCCFAQDLRKLVRDGAPSTNLYGAELKPEFISLSYELFLDKDTFGAHFMQADIFEEGGALQELEGKMDIVQVGLFLHLFDLEGQTAACKKIVRLLKQEKGVLVTGQQVGATEPVQMPRGSGSKMYKHNAESFEKMWRDVGEQTGTQWKVTASLDAGLGIEEKKRTWDDPNTRRLVFEVERIR